MGRSQGEQVELLREVCGRREPAVKSRLWICRRALRAVFA